jgi:NADH-quinone oxidoreductase subunit K
MYNLNFIIAYLLIVAIILLLFKNNFLFFFVALELIFLAINLQWIYFSVKTGNTDGATVALILLALAAVDAAIGLSLLLRYFSISYTGKIQLSEMIHIKG